MRPAARRLPNDVDQGGATQKTTPSLDHPAAVIAGTSAGSSRYRWFESFSAKRPGMQLDLHPVQFDFDFGTSFKIELPEGFQRAEFLEEHGFIDFVVHRKDLRSEIARLIDFCVK